MSTDNGAMLLTTVSSPLLTFEHVTLQNVDEVKEDEDAVENSLDCLKRRSVPLSFCHVIHKGHVDESKEITARKFLAKLDLMTLSTIEEPSSYHDSVYYSRKYHDIDENDRGYIMFDDIANSRYVDSRYIYYYYYVI